VGDPDGEFTGSEVVFDRQRTPSFKPYIEAKDVARFVHTQSRWLEWGTRRAPARFARQTFPELYLVPEKILAVKVCGENIRCTYDDQGVHHNDSLMACVPWHMLRGVRNNSIRKTARYIDELPARPNLGVRETLEGISGRFLAKYLLGVMNSKVVREFLRANRRSNVQLYPDDWKKVRIPDVGASEQAPIVAVVGLLLSLLRHLPGDSSRRTAADTIRIGFLEDLNDGLVHRLYQANDAPAQADLGALVTAAKLPADDKVKDAAHLDQIRAAIDAASVPTGPLRVALAAAAVAAPNPPAISTP
jgi:hypothetical protein